MTSLVPLTIFILIVENYSDGPEKCISFRKRGVGNSLWITRAHKWIKTFFCVGIDVYRKSAFVCMACKFLIKEFGWANWVCLPTMTVMSFNEAFCALWNMTTRMTQQSSLSSGTVIWVCVCVCVDFPTILCFPSSRDRTWKQDTKRWICRREMDVGEVMLTSHSVGLMGSHIDTFLKQSTCTHVMNLLPILIDAAFSQLIY